MSDQLKPGDRCYFLSKAGLKLRCIVAPDSLTFGKTRGEELTIPVIRPISRKRALRLQLDHPGAALPVPKIRWKKRSELRKLPGKPCHQEAH